MSNALAKLDKATQIFEELKNQVEESWKNAPRTKIKRGETSKVYFILDGDLVKVGIAENPQERLKEIKTSRPYAYLFGFIDGGRTKEAEIHKILSKWKYGREWFHYTDEVVTIVEDYLRGAK